MHRLGEARGCGSDLLCWHQINPLPFLEGLLLGIPVILSHAHRNPDKWASYSYIQKGQLRIRELSGPFRSYVWQLSPPGTRIRPGLPAKPSSPASFCLPFLVLINLHPHGCSHAQWLGQEVGE